MLNISCIFSILVSRLSVTSFCFQDFGSFLVSLFWIIFQVDSLSPPLLFDFVGIYHVPLPAEYFSAFSSCLGCCVWSGLSVCWKFVVPLYCGGSSLWVGLDEWLVKVFWLGKLALVFWWVELDLLSLECKCPVVNFEVSLCLVWLLATCILMLRVMFLNCWRISLVCLALKLVGSWMEFGFSVGMEDELLLINVPWSHAFSGILKFWI